MPGIKSSLTEAAAALAVGESNPMGLKCSGTSGALFGFVSHISSGEHQSVGSAPSASTAWEILAKYCPSKSEQTFQAAAGAQPCGTALPMRVWPRYLVQSAADMWRQGEPVSGTGSSGAKVGAIFFFIHTPHESLESGGRNPYRIGQLVCPPQLVWGRQVHGA